MKMFVASACCLLLASATSLFVWYFGHRVADLGPHGDTIMASVAVTMVLAYAASGIAYASWCGSQRDPFKTPLNPGLDAENLRLGVKAGVYGLNPGKLYRVIREVKDYHGNVFPVGMDLTFVQRHYLPYHGGHTVVFRPQSMYLQDEENADVLGHLDAYLVAVSTEASYPSYQPGY